MKRHLQCAEQQMSRSNLTKYFACHEKWVLCLILVTYETSFPMRGATGLTIQPHQILRLPRKMTLQDFRKNLQKQVKRHFQCGDDPSMIRAWSDHENENRNPPRKWGYFSSSPGAFSIVKHNVSSPILHSNIHQVLRLPQKVTLDLHQILPLPRKVTLEPHMKRHLQCAEQQMSRSNRTKYCACHEKWVLCLILVTYETSFPMRGATGLTIQPHQILRLPRKMTLQDLRKNLQKQVKRHFQCGDDPSMIRAWSDHENENRNPPRKWGYFSGSPEAFSIVKYNVSSPILHSNIHQVLRLPQKVTLDLHQILPLPRKVTLELHQILPLPRKVTLELHQVLHLPRKVTLDLHQVLHLPRKVTVELHLLYYSTLLDSTLPTLLDSTLLDSTLLDSTLLDLLYLTLLYLTLFYLTLLYLTLLYVTYSTWHYSTLLDTILLDTTLLNFTGMSFVYRKFLI